MPKIYYFLLFVALSVIVCGTSSADPAQNNPSSDSANEPVLTWAGDSEGGAPYCSPDPIHPEKIVGYEVDLINAIAQKIHRKAQFVQNSWDGLVPGLTAHNYDVIINGLEITPEREQVVSFSDPYYVTYEQLTVRIDDQTLRTLDDCVRHHAVVGTLKATSAEDMMRSHGGIDIRTYDGQINMFQDLQLHRLDAVLIDYPASVYCALINPRLKFAGEPIGQISYGIAMRKEDRVLLGQINSAISELKASGELAAICQKWGLWPEATAHAMNLPINPPGGPVPQTEWLAYKAEMAQPFTAMERFWQYVNYLPALLQGAVLTMALSITSMAIAVALGLILALLRLYGPAPISFLVQAFIEVIRGTPLLIQLYFIYYGLPNLFPALQFPPFVAAILGLGINYATSEAENYRAGLQAVPKAQREAAEALGLNLVQSLRYVILPQAFRIVIPPITTDFIALIKDSSLVSVITMVELTKVYGQLAATYYDYFGLGIETAAVYFLIGLPFVRLSQWAEKRFN